MVPASDSKSSRRALDWQDACTPAAREAGKASSGFCEGSKVRQRENAPDAGNARQPERTADGPPVLWEPSHLHLRSSCSTGRTPPPLRPPATACSPVVLQVLRIHRLTALPAVLTPETPAAHQHLSCLLTATSAMAPPPQEELIYCAHTVRSCVVIPDPHPCQEECLVSIPIYTRGNGSPDRLNISLGLPSPSLTVVP